MASSIFKKKTSNIDLNKKCDRRNAFRIRRFKNDHGFQVYSLENSAESRKIFVPRFIFGRFRASIRSLLTNEISKPQQESFELTTTFLNREYFYMKSSNSDLDNLIIQDLEEREGSSGYITVSRRYLHALDELLYNKALQHPNDVLEEIISYHKLFQFSFVKGSKSITSGLALRKDVLQATGRYTPSLAKKVPNDGDAGEAGKKGLSRPAIERRKGGQTQNALFKPRLGERFNEKDIKIDYEDIFGDEEVLPNAVVEDNEKKEAKTRKANFLLSQFAVPLSASEVKEFGTGRFYFELSVAQASEFRDHFISDRSCDFFVGFEIIDALFSYDSIIKTFQFPLYYARVRIRESGRGVHLEIADDGLFYLNHLALAELTSRFSSAVAGVDPVDQFFTTLLAQDISLDRLNDRIHLSRYLPIKEAIFDRTREILLGYQDENGKGGILGDLKVKGIECDLQSVFLYRAPRLLNPIDQALESDLDQIRTIAHDFTSRFYSSLLGRFLTPEQQTSRPRQESFAPVTWMPGAQPQSTRSLVERLDEHELVLLEGPPGTGKTHAIMNLLIHCINSRQRVLIVSDQQGAIEALIEMLQDYLIGQDRGTPAERKWKELLFSAIKVVDDVQIGEQTLQETVSSLSETFKVQDPGPGLAPKGEDLEKKVRALAARIEKLKTQITQKMHGYMGDDVAFDIRVLEKDEAQADTQALIEFLDLLQGRNSTIRELLDSFVHNRFKLIQDDMQECYSFFKIPARNFEQEVSILKEDEKILSVLLEENPRTIEDFQDITREHPRHEIIRYLESVIQVRAPSQATGLKRLYIRIRSLLKPPLRSSTRILLKLVQDQIGLLTKSQSWSDSLWELLRELHESIRIGDQPNRALNLYRSISNRPGSPADVNAGKGSSIQGSLEQIDDLFEQQGRLVRERLIENLREIVRSATVSKRSSGTDNVTSIMALAESLVQFNSIAESGPVFNELRQKLYDTFPVWVVRKQAVPFLLPCTEQSFDLVIVDEATQCRVDDTMSLMYRAKKILVVGDDKQTVLQKNSVIDDYLFKDHELDEHLRETQARGFKGGGSHIFALVKAIKQSSVMLDEHYRCPADIIEFSNKYVYDNGLNVMQWSLPENPPAVVVDYSEQDKESARRATSGKFKGIETDMVDRYLEFVAESIKEIERSTGTRVNVDTDVALCYFLLKNEPYVKYAKGKLLKELNRGEDLLDGAGAALQGKERDYIFYLWDVTRYNIGAFKQGDDADKRKGELNVLMSRPKKKAFHYLHRNFDQLDHSRTNITNYLWLANSRREASLSPMHGQEEASARSLLGALLKFSVQNSGKRSIKDVRENLRDGRLDFRENIAVGDAGRVVDLIAFAKGKPNNVVGLVDLSGFGSEQNVGPVVVDYYFQLKRVSPDIDPVFIFPHELVDENGQTFQSLMHKLEHLDFRNT